MSFGNYYEALTMAKLRMAEIEKEAEQRRRYKEAFQEDTQKSKGHKHPFLTRLKDKRAEKGRIPTSDTARVVGIEADNPLTYTGL